MTQHSKESEKLRETKRKPNHPCRKIKSGKYLYRGQVITRIGYYEPDQRVVWEAYDKETGHADYHGFSKAEVKRHIDADLSKD